MNFKNLIIDIIYILFIIPLFYLTNNNIFLYTLSYYLYLILSNLFNHVNNYESLVKFYENKSLNSLNKIYKYTNVSILFINLIISVLITLISLVFNNLFEIKGFILVNFFMSLTLFINPILNNLINILKIYNFKMLSLKVINIYKIITLLLKIFSIFICFKVLNIKDYIGIIIIYLCDILGFLIIYFLCLFALKNKLKTKQLKTQEEKINYKNEIKKILSNNINKSISNLFSYSIFYTSVIILYFLLKNKYAYSYDILTETINNSYLYAISILNIILKIFNYLFENKIIQIKENIKNKNYHLIKLEDKIINLFKLLLIINIFLGITSDAIWTIIFNNDNGYILYMFSNLLIFYVLYDFIIKISLDIIDNKKIYLSLILGLTLKLILIVPLTNIIYRFGNNLLYGDMLSNIISYIFVIILLLKSNNDKYKIDFIKKFDKILNIIYYSIILCIILLLFTLIIPVSVNNRFDATKVVIIYLIITIIYILIRKKMYKNERINVKNRKQN